MDACGIPNKANWYTSIIVSRPHESGHGTETDYVDIYTCEEHFPGYPDGSMSDEEAHSMLQFDGADRWEVLEHHSTHLRDTPPEPRTPASFGFPTNV